MAILAGTFIQASVSFATLPLTSCQNKDQWKNIKAYVYFCLMLLLKHQHTFLQFFCRKFLRLLVLLSL